MSNAVTIATKAKLFQIQDADRPMWVIACDWNQALTKWKEFVGVENALPADEVDGPRGITLVCDETELLQ